MVKSVSFVAKYSNDIFCDCKLQYEKYPHYYRVSIDKETNEMDELEDVLKHFDFSTTMLSMDNTVEEVLVFVKSYPTLSLNKEQLKENKIREFFKNLITFEFRDI